MYTVFCFSIHFSFIFIVYYSNTTRERTEYMQFRHEIKHNINYSDLLVLKARLDAAARPDPHARDGCYHIRSLYFDTFSDKALREKQNGISSREKFRIRCYDGDFSFIKLEKKCKIRDLGYKKSCSISAQQVQKLLDGNTAWMASSGEPLLLELYTRMKTQGLAPKSIVDYKRRPYIFDAGNVRVTFDYEIRTSSHPADFFDCSCPMLAAPDDPIILEVKWDNYLPSIIADCVQLKGRMASGYSKYAISRIHD